MQGNGYFLRRNWKRKPVYSHRLMRRLRRAPACVLAFGLCVGQARGVETLVPEKQQTGATLQRYDGCCQSNANSSPEVARFVNVMRVSLPKTASARIRGKLWNHGMIAGDDCDRQTSNLGPTRLF